MQDYSDMPMYNNMPIVNKSFVFKGLIRGLSYILNISVLTLLLTHDRFNFLHKLQGISDQKNFMLKL